MIQRSVAVPVEAQPQPDSSENELLEPLLRLAGGEINTTRVLIVAEHGLDLMCALLRHGCPAATAIRPDGKPDTDAYDLVVAPLGSATATFSLDTLIRQVRCALAPSGRLVACVSNGRVATALARRLRLNGFSALRLIHLPTLMLLRADLQRLS
jgi:hypothetical protein